jgi:hypothetical protein
VTERAEFIRKCEEILDFFDIYNALRHEYIEKFFPGSKKTLNYLLKNRRLYKSDDGILISTVPDPPSDKCLLAALGVLADIFEKVQGHVKATAPAQISFTTHSGDYYEIIYVGYGMEAMVSAFFETQLAEKKQSSIYNDTAKLMVIVEDKNQMTRLQMPRITRFALVQPDGSLSYFKGS